MLVFFFKVMSSLLGPSDTVQFVLLGEKLALHLSAGSSTSFTVEIFSMVTYVLVGTSFLFNKNLR